jgi:hypothetical protein
MAKLVIVHDVDPCIGITLEEVLPGTPGRARGYHGSCTECGWPMHRWHRDRAIQDAKAHVDSHAPVLIGGDRDALVRT